LLTLGSHPLTQSQVKFDDRVVAEVGGQAIVVGQLQEALLAERKRAITENRLDAFGSDAAEKTLKGLTDVKVFALAGRDRHIDRRPDVQHRIEMAVDEVIAQAQLADVVASLPLSDQALREYYEGHLDQFRSSPRLHARHIITRTREEAEAAATELRGGADFDAVARIRNIDSTRSSGGDLGWVIRGVMVPAFEKALFALKPGQKSNIVQTSFGFHIIRLEEIEPGKVPQFENIRDEVRRRAIDSNVEDAKGQLLQRFRVNVRREVLESIGR
jgi:peptidyl-prolyl cis-trans isomerase C